MKKIEFDFDTIFWIFCAAMLIFMAGIGVGSTLEAGIRNSEIQWHKAD
jgi:hypothetical protein